MFKLKSCHKEPIVQKGSPGTENNRYGFEGGTVVKIGDTYHLFTSELADEPKCVKMNLAYWTSKDKIHFERRSTLFASTGNFTGEEARAALWSPMPTFDEADNRWNLTYVDYRCAPDTEAASYTNHNGRIWRAVSIVPGMDGIGGPYEDVGVILEPGADSDSWEGLQGVDSFYPYQAGDRWLAFYGSAHTQTMPIAWWGVGLAEAKELAGPWKRCSALNPVLIDDKFVENPIVAKLDNGLYVAFYDGGPFDLTGRGTFGYSVSRDGINWSKGQYIYLPPEKISWQKLMRTPLCLIPEDDGTYTVYYTAFTSEGYGNIGLLSLALDEQ